MANVDANSAVGQVQKANKIFADFFAAIGAALPDGGAFPEFSESLANLDYSELLRTARMGQTGSANYPGAAAVENVHHIAAVMREYGLRSKGKSQYYDDGEADCENETEFYTAMSTFYTNMLQGVYTEGATS
jgi:hypothetical protein